MYSRWYEVAVVLLWFATMSWLITQKVMPALMVGDPPSAESMLDARKPDLPLCWSLAWNDRPLGWAMSTTSLLPDGSTKIRSRVCFEELPLTEMIPKWLKALLVPLGRLEDPLQMETRSVLVFSPEAVLRRFESSVQLEPGINAIEVRGVIEGALLSVNVRSGTFSYETEMGLAPKTVLSDALSPETSLPGLHAGQTWTVKLYSPLRPPNSPVEILQAKVEKKQPMIWDDRRVDAWLVTYRTDAGSVLGRSGKPRATLWVHPDGTVLKQQATILDSTMTFVRLSDEKAAELAKGKLDW